MLIMYLLPLQVAFGHNYYIVTELARGGFAFSSKMKREHGTYPKIIDGGERVAVADGCAGLVSKYRTEGMDYPEAIAKMSSEFYADIVTVMLSTNAPENIFVTRISRPMSVMTGQGETYIATTEFAFPDNREEYAIGPLPVMQSCVMFSGGYTVTRYRVEGNPMSDITPTLYSVCSIKWLIF